MTAAARSLFAVVATAWTAPASCVTDRPATTLRTGICRRAAPYLFLAALAIGPAASVWSVGPDPLIDFGRELYVPWRITEGDVLYRDVAYFNGPVSSYVNAAWFQLFGVGITTLRVANLAVFAMTTALAYRLFSKLASPSVALVAAALLPLISGFGNYTTVPNYNFLTPYSHEMTHGLLLSLAALNCASGATPLSNRRALLAGICLGGVLLTKPEFVLATVAGLVTIVGFTAFDKRYGLRYAGKATMALCGGALLPVGVAVSALSMAMSVGEAAGNCFGAWQMAASTEIRELDFYRRCLGTYDLAASLELLGISVICGLIALGTSRLIDRFLHGSAVPVVGFAAGVAGLTWAQAAHFNWGILERALPIWCAALAVCEGVRCITRQGAAASAARLAWCLFSLGLTAKIVLFCRITHYGFVLALPALATVVMALFDWLPQRTRGASASALPWLAAPLLVGYLAHYYDLQNRHSNSGVVCGVTAGDRIEAGPDARPVAEGVALLAQSVAADETVAVLPEGASLNYLARRRSSLTHYTWLPPEVIHFGEATVLAELQARPPDWIVLAPCHLDEYGKPAFGSGYCDATAAWIDAHYAETHRWGDGAWQLRRRVE